jgi:hypothetical protein
MAKILLNENKTTGVQTWYETEDESQRATVKQDVDDILSYAANMRQATQGESYGDMRKIGVIPMSVLGQAMREGWAYDQKRIREWLARNPAFKTFDRKL